MANPTVQVQQVNVDYADEAHYWPIGSSSTTYYPGEMIGINASGQATHFDDTAALKFAGIFFGPQFVIDSTTPAAMLYIKVLKPKLFSMPAVSGTPSRLTDIGKPVYAQYSGVVQIGTSGLTYNNCAGIIEDIYVSNVTDLTGTTAQGWYIRPAGGSVTVGSPRLPVTAVTAAGAVLNNAAALSEGFNLVAGADGAKGVVLPTASAGMVVIVKNNAAAASPGLLVYPAAGAAINALAANSNYNMITNYSCSMFIAYNASLWETLPLVAS